MYIVVDVFIWNPTTFWLPFISNRISLRLLITDTSDFVKIWRVMNGRYSEHRRTKQVIGQSHSRMLSDRALCICHFGELCKLSAPCMRFVIKVWGIFLVLEYSLSTTSIILHTYHQQMRRDGSHAIPSNWPTEVSLQWTWFKVGNPTQKQNAYHLQWPKDVCSYIL